MKVPRKKERDIVKLLYNENLEYERVKTWWKQKSRTLGCRHHCSSKAHKEFGIDLTTIANGMIGYIEYLEERIPSSNKTTKDGQV